MVTFTLLLRWHGNQVEHHLFPQIPRHNLKRVHERVVKFCREEGVSFHEAGEG